VFANPDAADEWFKENDPEGVVFEYPYSMISWGTPRLISEPSGKQRQEISASGYVAHTLEAALWSVGRTSDYRSAVLMAANLGEDADTTAAVAGQLAGTLYGVSGIPRVWVSRVAWRQQIVERASNLLAA